MFKYLLIFNLSDYRVYTFSKNRVHIAIMRVNYVNDVYYDELDVFQSFSKDADF